MRRNPVRLFAAKVCERILRLRTRPLHLDTITGPVLAVAAHADDETVGPGGTLALLTARGVEVHILVLTDGVGPNWRLVEPAEMATLRAAEARAAAAAMGVPAERLTLGGLPGGFLRRDHEMAVGLLAAALDRIRPTHVFVTLQHDGQHDHDAAWDAARRAVRESGLHPVLLGYPIWAWRQWPWVSANPLVLRPRIPPGGGIETAARPYARPLGGIRLIAQLNVRVDISQALGHKRAALAEHRSQVERREGNPDWRTLADVAGGEFLERLMGPCEYFRLVRP